MSKATSKFVVCWITAPSIKVAESLAHSLVLKRLVACVNIIPQVRSVYSWKGKVCSDDEVILMAKTKRDHIGNIAEHLKENHPYDVPELIASNIEDGLPAYLDWVSSAVKNPSSD